MVMNVYVYRGKSLAEKDESSSASGPMKCVWQNHLRGHGVEVHEKSRKINVSRGDRVGSKKML